MVQTALCCDPNADQGPFLGLINIGSGLTSGKARKRREAPGGKFNVTPPLEAGTKPMGFPPWSRGPLLHRGEKRQLSPLVEHGDSNPVFDIT